MHQRKREQFQAGKLISSGPGHSFNDCKPRGMKTYIHTFSRLASTARARASSSASEGPASLVALLGSYPRLNKRCRKTSRLSSIRSNSSVSASCSTYGSAKLRHLGCLRTSEVWISLRATKYRNRQSETGINKQSNETEGEKTAINVHIAQAEDCSRTHRQYTDKVSCECMICR